MTERRSPEKGSPYGRVVIKLSGEGLAGPGGRIDSDIVSGIAADLRSVIALGTQIAIVVGGGNFLRGSELPGFERTVADQMGMLATSMNGLALQDQLDRLGLQTRVMSAVTMHSFCEPFIRRRCIRHLEKGRVVILVGGTGNPFFTTDTAAALRASEISADCLLKATQVDGVYTADPKKDPKAQRYDSLGYQEIIEKGLQVMDTAAVVLCKERQIPVLVFNLGEPGNLVKACKGEAIGTLVAS